MTVKGIWVQFVRCFLVNRLEHFLALRLARRKDNLIHLLDDDRGRRLGEHETKGTDHQV